MTAWSDGLVARLSEAFADEADPERAAHQSAYLRGQYEFFGLAAPRHKAVLADALRTLDRPALADLDAFARAAYRKPQREWHYAAVKTLRRNARVLDPTAVPLVHHLVTTHSWWDTVDEIASHLAGTLVDRHPETAQVMDEWVASDDMWLARTAILHQLRFKHETDVDRLFGYCLARADEADFFYRKAIGWALRQYARTDPDAVRRFCTEHETRLSRLSLAEARKHLGDGS
ncbi:MAG: DNA alkylation repair protein [Actinomycetota bacterium]